MIKDMEAPKKGRDEDVAVERKPTILLVSDEAYIRELISALLSMEGYSVIEADDPHSAIDHAVFGGPIDLMLAEPVFSGGVLAATVFDVVKHHNPTASVIYMVGFPHDVYARLRLDPSDCMVKPFTPKALFARIKSTLASEATP